MFVTSWFSNGFVSLSDEAGACYVPASWPRTIIRK